MPSSCGAQKSSPDAASRKRQVAPHSRNRPRSIADIHFWKLVDRDVVGHLQAQSGRTPRSEAVTENAFFTSYSIGALGVREFVKTHQ